MTRTGGDRVGRDTAGHAGSCRASDPISPARKGSGALFLGTVRNDRRNRLRRLSAEPRSTHTEWWWSPSPTISRTIPAGYSSFENRLVIEVDPGPGSGYLWAHRFRLVGGGGGLVGLATPAEGAAGGSGRVAVFAISDTPPEAPTGAGVGPPSSPGMGWNARIPLEWQAGREYQLQAWTDRSGSWSALVADVATGRQSVIGQMQVPPDWRGLDSWSAVSIEYHGGPLPNCDHLAPTSTVFAVPTADGGRIAPEQSQSGLGPGTCSGSRVDPVPGGVRHSMGG